MPATQRGIYHNLRESKYAVSNSEIAFYFSSEFLLNKFLDGYKNNRESFENGMDKLMQGNPLNTDMLADLCFYEKTEKRGFLVRLNRMKISYDDAYKYALRRMNEQTSLDWCRMVL